MSEGRKSIMFVDVNMQIGFVNNQTAHIPLSTLIICKSQHRAS